MKNKELAFRRFAAILAIAILPGCLETKTGSNGTGALPTDGGKSLVAGTLVAVEPFSVGLATLDVGGATLRRDENANAGASELRLGMNLEAAGTVAGAYGTVPVVLREGSAQSAVRGPVISVDAAVNRFTVATFTFVVDMNTLYDGVAGFSALAPGAYVEVSGLPLANLRTLLATRITQAATPADGRISVSARIDSLTVQGLSLGGLSVPGVSSGSFSPAPPPLGGRARVSGIFNPQTATVTNEQVLILVDAAPAADTRVELEGIALNVAPNGAFLLRTPAHDYDVAPGPQPVTSGARVRVVATAASPSLLTSASITVIGSEPTVYRVSGTVSEFTSLAALRVRGEPVDLTLAVIRGGSASDIANGRRLAIVGTAGPGALRVTEATLLP